MTDENEEKRDEEDPKSPLDALGIEPPVFNAETMDYEQLAVILEQLSPSTYISTIDRERPYDGQPHTDTGKRGQTEVQGLTYRDLRDCFIRGCYDASGLPPEEWPGTIYALPLEEMDILAVWQNMSLWIEKYQGIYPNIERPLPADPREPHWCGWPLDVAEWVQGHEGECR